MSVITVQIGQCGNQARPMHGIAPGIGQIKKAFNSPQIGAALFESLAAATGGDEDAANLFFRRPGAFPSSSSRPARQQARAVLLDMEPKVVSAAKQAAKGSTWQYSHTGSFSQQNGSGNNWARGYLGYGSQFADVACDLVRREVEEADHLGGFLLLQSMAGGTGAGFGTRVAEALRDDFPQAFLTNYCIWPYETGEIIVQGYNTLLTLAHLTAVSDGIVVVENAALHRACQCRLSIARPSFTDMNSVAAQALASALLPARLRPAAGSSGLRGKPLTLFGDHVEHLCPHPGYRILSLRAVPQMPATSVDFTTFTWQSVLRQLRQMHITGSSVEDRLDWSVKAQDPRSIPINKSLASLLLLRGNGAMDADASSFAGAALYASWALQPLAVAASTTRFAEYDMAATMLSNCQACAAPISRMQRKAWGMLSAKAYLHQYERCGLEAAELEDALIKAEDVVERYRGL